MLIFNKEEYIQENLVSIFELSKIAPHSLSKAIAGLTLSVACLPMAFAGDYFSPHSLTPVNGQNIAELQSLEQFSTPGGQQEGEYHVDIVLNGRGVGSKSLVFVKSKEEQKLIPVLTKEELENWGVNVKTLPTFANLTETQPIEDISKYIPDAYTRLELTNQKLIISIPQIAMNKTASGTVDPSLWDDGVPALVLSYFYRGSNTWYKSSHADTSSHYVNLRSGLNVGPWRLKNYSTYSYQNNQSRWQNIETYLERGINPLKSQLTIGDTSTPSEVFDGFQFRGAKLASDESMIPSSLRGFAPIIRGIAQSNAEITIKQNDYIIYQSYVSPGPFEINDLYSTGTSGDLTVTVKEADGSERSFIVPFSSLAIMQREGQLKYAVTGGKFKNNNSGKEPNFAQATVIYGLPKGITAYGGGLFSKDYQSYAAGIGLNLGYVGALSSDVTQAKTKFTQFDNRQKTGQSYRVQYTKNLLTTGTTVTFAGYRYSTEGFYSFPEANANYLRDSFYSKKNRYQATVNQDLEAYGNLYVSAYQQDFWNQSGHERTLNAGYNNNYKGYQYTLNYSYSDFSGYDKADHQFVLSFSIPLGGLSINNSMLNLSMSSNNRGDSNYMAGLSGSLLDDHNLNYSVQQSYGNRNQKAQGNASLSYKSTYTIANAGYSYDQFSQRANYGLNGAIVVHSDGVTLSQPIYDSFAIVKAPGAKGVKVKNKTGIRTDWRGYAIVPYLSAYTQNEVLLDTTSLPENVDLQKSALTLVPTRGAAMLAEFKTYTGYRVLLTVTHNGKAVPFGSIGQLVSEQDGLSSGGIVGDNGDIYFSGMPEQGKIHIKWGNQTDEQCMANYQLNEQEKQMPVASLQAICE